MNILNFNLGKYLLLLGTNCNLIVVVDYNNPNTIYVKNKTNN